jgi:carotenoid cleavage dioxygenase
MDLPIVFNLDVAIAGTGMPFRWDDTYGARFGVLRRDDPFGEIRWFDIEPCYVFHVANAYDTADGNSIELQAVRYPELWRNDGGFDAEGALWSWTINLADGTVAERQLDDRAVEFPRIDDRLAGLPARYTVSVAGDRLVRYDLAGEAAVEHGFGGGTPSEAVFVPAGSGRADESNGWYMAYVYDPARNGSDLVILDASDFGGRPVATIKLPQRVPYGFHGNWISG